MSERSDEELSHLREMDRPLEEAEAAVVRSVVSEAPWLPEKDERALRYALNLARLRLVRTRTGDDLYLAPLLLPLREEVLSFIPSFSLSRELNHERVLKAAMALSGKALAFRETCLRAFPERLRPEELDREVCEKALVVVCGGGGAVAYSYLAAFHLLERYQLVPRLLAGTSMGAALSLVRARHLRWQPEETGKALGKVTFRTLFRFLEGESRYGLPAAMRLYLRAAVGEYLTGRDGHPLTLSELEIPLIVAITGVRNGALPHDPSYYEHLLDFEGKEERGGASLLSRVATDVFSAMAELFAQRDRLARVYLGADERTGQFDAIDAVGFSSALPGVVHYDVLRDDKRMRALLDALFLEKDLFRLVDGGLVDNLPAREAYFAVMRGRIGSRNAFVLGLEGFFPRLSQPLWYGLQQLAAGNVAWNRPFIHLHKTFTRGLSPADILPEPADLRRAVNDGKAELHPDMPFLAHMIRPFERPSPG